MRDNTERLRPPRFLWVPFELGRPFGAPGDPAFQTKVLRALLALFEREDGPVILEDFPEDAPGGAPDDGSGWVCPISLPKPEPETDSAILAAVLQEIDTLAPWYELACETRDRTTFGVCGLEVDAVAAFLNDLFETTPANPVPDTSLGQALRLASEDLRNWYLEAATARPGGASSRALADWFWSETAAGAMLLALQPVCAKSADESVRHVAESQFVPRAQRHRLD